METRNIKNFYLEITIDGKKHKFQHEDKNLEDFIKSISTNTDVTEVSVNLCHESGTTIIYRPHMDPDDDFGEEEIYLFNNKQQDPTSSKMFHIKNYHYKALNDYADNDKIQLCSLIVTLEKYDAILKNAAKRNSLLKQINLPKTDSIPPESLIITETLRWLAENPKSSSFYDNYFNLLFILPDDSNNWPYDNKQMGTLFHYAIDIGQLDLINKIYNLNSSKAWKFNPTEKEKLNYLVSALKSKSHEVIQFTADILSVSDININLIKEQILKLEDEDRNNALAGLEKLNAILEKNAKQHLEKHLNDSTFKLQIQIDNKIYYISADDAIKDKHPQCLSVEKLLKMIEDDKTFNKSSIKLLHKNGDTVVVHNPLNESNNRNSNTLYFYKRNDNPTESFLSQHAKEFEAIDEPQFDCKNTDKELLINLIGLMEANHLEQRLANLTIRNRFLKIGKILKSSIEDRENLNPYQILDLLSENLPMSYEPSAFEPFPEISLFHLAIQSGVFELVEKIYNTFNINKNWLDNEITQGLSRKESHIISALKTNSPAIINFVASNTSISENEMGFIEDSILKLSEEEKNKAEKGLKILVSYFKDKRKADLQRAIAQNDIKTINLLYDIKSHDIIELINLALKQDSNESALSALSVKAIESITSNKQTTECILILAKNKLLDAKIMNDLINNYSQAINEDALTFLLVKNHITNLDTFIERHFEKFSTENIIKLLHSGKISEKNIKLIFNLPIEKLCQPDLLVYISRNYKNNASLVHFISKLSLNQITPANYSIALPLMLAYQENTDKIAQFIKENKYDLIHLLLISMSYKKNDKSKEILLDHLSILTPPSTLNKLDLLLAKSLGDDKIYNKILSILPMNEAEKALTPSTTDFLDEIKKYNKIPLTEEIRKSLIEIQKICNDKYYNQSFFGNDALNRQMLLDGEIAKLLTPEVITYLFTNKPIPETKIQRNSTGVINLKDAIYYGFKEGLHVIHKLANNEKSYGLSGYNQQDSNFSNNTMKIVKNISIAAGLPEIKEKEKNIDSNNLAKQYEHVVATVNLLKMAHKSDYLLFVPNYSSHDIRMQTQGGFHQLTTHISNLENETLDSFCEKILSNTEAMLDGTVIHLFYDRVHLEAALELDDRFNIGGQEYTLQDIFRAMISTIMNAPDPDKYFHAKEQICLRLGLVENHLKDKFKKEYEQAAVKLGYAEEVQNVDIHDTSNHVLEGPQNRTTATIDLQDLIKTILIACKENRQINVTFNDDDDMIISIKNENNIENYNLTSILKGEPNWEHISLDSNDMDNYESFLKNAANPPVYGHIEKARINHKSADIDEIKREFPLLTLAECSAIHHYSSELYIAINYILRFNGQSGFLDLLHRPDEPEFASLARKFNNNMALAPGEHPSNLNHMVIEALLVSAFSAHALTKRFWYDRMVIASSLDELKQNLKTMSGFVIAMIGEGDNKQIAVIQHGEIINFDQNQNLPTIDFKQFYSKLQSKGEQSLLGFTADEITLIQKSLSTDESNKLISFEKPELNNPGLDNRFLACLIEEIGEINAYPMKKIYRADRNSAFMDSYVLSIVDTLTKGGQAYRVAKGFYSTSETLQRDFFMRKPGIATTLIFPSGTVFKAANLSSRPIEKEYLLPPGQQLLYTASVKAGEHKGFEAKPVRGVQYKEQEAPEKSAPPAGEALTSFGILSQAKTPNAQPTKKNKDIKKGEKEKKESIKRSDTGGEKLNR